MEWKKIKKLNTYSVPITSKAKKQHISSDARLLEDINDCVTVCSHVTVENALLVKNDVAPGIKIWIERGESDRMPRVPTRAHFVMPFTTNELLFCRENTSVSFRFINGAV